MPRLELTDCVGMITWRCDSMRPETISAWLDEILPLAWTLTEDPSNADWWPQIMVYPMLLDPRAVDADWWTDSRVHGIRYRFAATTGAEGLAELERLRNALADALTLSNTGDMVVRIGEIARDGAP